MSTSFLRSLLLMLCVISTVSGCGDPSTGHTDDKTPGGEPTPELMDDKAMDEYTKQQNEKAGQQ